MDSTVFQGHRMPQLGLVTALDNILCPHKDAYSGCWKQAQTSKQQRFKDKSFHSSSMINARKYWNEYL